MNKIFSKYKSSLLTALYAKCPTRLWRIGQQKFVGNTKSTSFFPPSPQNALTFMNVKIFF